MEQIANKKLTVFLVAVILFMGVLIALKIINKSYALPSLEVPVINSVSKTTDDPLQVQIKYTLTNVQEDYSIEIINNTEAKSYRENISKYEGVNEYYINDLQKGKTYEFSVKMCSAENSCVESSSKTIEIEQESQDQNQNTDPNQNNNNPTVDTSAQTLGKVNNITFSNITTNSVTAGWNAASNATGYIMKYKLVSRGGWREHRVSGPSVKINSLKANTWYEVAVKPVNNNETGTWIQKKFLTNPYVPGIGGFNAKAVNYSQIKITWKKSSNKNVTYELYRSVNGKNYSRIKTLGRNTTTFTNKGLAANKNYYYKMKVYDNKTQRGKTFYSGYTATKRVKTPVKNKSTYIVVSIKDQKLWFYKKGKLIVKSNVVTGKNGKNRTPKGTYKIRKKARSTYLVGRDYVSFVNYWMLIDSRTQIGLHDATWRSKFGGTIYKRNGSHGCINLPLKTAKTIYKKAPKGTKVIIK